MEILIKYGRIIDPANQVDMVCDLLIQDGKIIKVSRDIEPGCDTEILNARGLWVTPGLIDLHVHFRDPGLTYKEDIFSGSKSAAAGGFTTVVTMPNTKPVTDNADTVQYILQKAGEAGLINIIPCGSVTLGQDGGELSDIHGMVAAGARAISEDGKTVDDQWLLCQALDICRELNIPMLSHCEDMSLVNRGVMNEGEAALRLNLPGIPNAAEYVIISRDIMLAAVTKAKLHICHISTQKSLDLVRFAKKNQVSVTAEAAPHHFILSDEDVDGTDSNYKMNPPLRGKKDVEAVLNGLADGTIDCIATDHAPHHESEKGGDFINAANGIIGLETSLPLCITHLVDTAILTPYQLIEKMSVNPAKILGLNKGSISVGDIADITVIDPNEEYLIGGKFYSKAANSPFIGRKVKGRVKYTIVNGKIVYTF